MAGWYYNKNKAGQRKMKKPIITRKKPEPLLGNMEWEYIKMIKKAFGDEFEIKRGVYSDKKQEGFTMFLPTEKTKTVIKW